MKHKIEVSVTTKNLRILVVDDSEVNRKAAQDQLGKDNTLIVVGTYEEAQKLLGGGYVEGEWKESEETFDMALVDLLLPASDQQQSSREHVGKEMPIGIFLALLAAKQGVKHIAVFTDSNHHSHPASACFDIFNQYRDGYGGQDEPSFMKVEEAKVVLSNTSIWIEYFNKSDFSKPVGTDEACERVGSWGLECKPEYCLAKCWDKLAEWLLNGEEVLTKARQPKTGNEGRS
ncbi:MAG: response regulator [bacterium]|nr:response regulator [bacterium]